MKSSMFIPSGKGNPCPVCGRTKDGDCRTAENGNIVLCHTQQSESDHPDYKYVGETQKGAGWGKWIAKKGIKSPKVKRSSSLQSYVYQDRQGNPLARVTRKGRDFRQYHWNGKDWKPKVPDTTRKRIPIYRYAEVRKAIAQGRKIWIVEGESTADALWDIGLPATTFIGGSNGYKEYGNYENDLKGASVILCPDRDSDGVMYMEMIAEDYPEHQWCKVFPDSPMWKYLPAPKKGGGVDGVDWIAEGATIDDFMAAVSDRHPLEVHNKKPASKIDFSEAMTQLREELKAARSPAEKEWIAIQYAQKSGLVKNGLNGRSLLRMAEEEQKRSDDIEVEDMHDVVDNAGHTDFLIEGIVPTPTTILVGADAGMGKTTLLYSMAQAIASEDIDWSGYPTKHGNVLIIQTDEGRSDAGRKLRIQRAKEKCDRGRIGFVWNWSFLQWEATKRLIREKGYRAVIVDSLTSVTVGKKKTDTTAGDDIYLMRDFAEEAGVTFLIIHHLNNQGAFRDTSAFRGNVSNTWMIRPPKNERRWPDGTARLTIQKSRAGLEGEYMLAKVAHEMDWKMLGFASSPDRVDEEPLFARLREYMSYLPGEKVTSSDIALSFETTNEYAETRLAHLAKVGVLESEWVAIADLGGSAGGYFRYWMPERNGADRIHVKNVA